MPLDFPNSPTAGQIFTAMGTSWRWDGVKWVSGPALMSDDFVAKSGDTMTGLLTNSTAGVGLSVTNSANLATASTGQVLIGGTSLSGKTRIEFNPTNPQAGRGVFHMNKVNSTTGTDDPQINSYVSVDHSGGNQYRHMRIQTVITGNPGGGPNSGVWSILNQLFTKAHDLNGSNVLQYNQAVRTDVNAGSVKGAALWSGIFEARSQTGLPSSQDGIIQPIEVDLFANGLDNLSPSIGRTCISVVIGKDNTSGPTCEVTHGISFYGSSGVYKRVIGMAASYNESVLDTRSATAVSTNAHAIWLKTGHTIGLDDAGVGGQPKFALRSTGTKVFIAVDGVDKFSIDASGNVRAAGTITGSVTP